MVKTKKSDRRIFYGASQLTTTDRPPGIEGRHKTRFTSDELPHRWSANVQERGSNGAAFYFDDGTIYSYGSHFPIARHVVTRNGKQFILFTARGYSSSTSSHKNATWGAIPKGTPVFTVYNVNADHKSDHEANLKDYKERALSEFRKSIKARGRKHEYLQECMRLIQEGNAYAKAVGLRKHLGSSTGDDLAKWGRLATAEAERLKRKAEAEQEERLRKAEIKARAEYEKWLKQLSEWQAGKIDNLKSQPWNPDADADRLDFVRVSRGKYLQTSRGVVVPLKAAMPVLRAIRANGLHQGTQDGFKVDQWEGAIEWTAGRFKIGCHTITFQEIERAAKAAGL